ncbi:hypothetical protein PM082_020832 [Marasmius tenuissimus]|nr:hypothetical protein PM082_020832 [Marasmius tenuissimus]
MNNNNGSNYEDLNEPASENPSEQQKMSDKCRYARTGTDTGGISGNWARQIVSEDCRYSQTSTVAELAVAELTQPGEIELKVVDLIKGENFDPEFIKLNPNATLPTLEADGQIYTSTFEVVQYLIKRSGKDVKPGHRELLDKIHEGRLNPNFALLLSRSEEERKAKAQGIPGAFLSGRQAALEKYSQSPSSKTSTNPVSPPTPPSSPSTKTPSPPHLQTRLLLQINFTLQRHRGFHSRRTTPVPPFRGFVVGGNGTKRGRLPFGCLDYQNRCYEWGEDGGGGGWWGRLRRRMGGREVPERVVEYWRAWARRDSFKWVYAEGLH